MNITNKEKLKQILEMARNEHNIDDIVKFIRESLNMTSGIFAKAVKELQNDFSDIDKELLYNIAYDYDRFQYKYAMRLQKILSFENECYAVNYLISIDFKPSILKSDIEAAKNSKIFSSNELNELNQIYESYKIIYEPIFKERIGNAISEGKNESFKKQYEKEVESAKLLIADIMNSNIRVDIYLKKHSLTNGDYLRALRVLNTFNEPLYEEYKNFTKSKSKQIFVSIISNGKKMVNELKNGVLLENGDVRDFDIIDYYNLTTLKLQEFLNIIKSELTPQEIVLYRRFANANGRINTLDLQQLYNQRQVFGVEFDKNNNPIMGTGREIQKEEKENIVNYLKESKLPLTINVYNAAFKRWKNGYLNMPTNFNLDSEQAKKI